MSDVMAAHAWRTNAHMLADLFRVMPPPVGEWCDLTYGESGGWWREPNIPPAGLVRCVGPGTVAPEGVETVRIDFRAAPFTELFDLITQRVNELNGPEGGSG